jgi:hypothetical protein
MDMRSSNARQCVYEPGIIPRELKFSIATVVNGKFQVDFQSTEDTKYILMVKRDNEVSEMKIQNDLVHEIIWKLPPRVFAPRKSDAFYPFIYAYMTDTMQLPPFGLPVLQEDVPVRVKRMFGEDYLKLVYEYASQGKFEIPLPGSTVSVGPTFAVSPGKVASTSKAKVDPGKSSRGSGPEPDELDQAPNPQGEKTVTPPAPP